MRQVSPVQAVVFALLLAISISVGVASTWLLFGSAFLGDFRGVVLSAAFLINSYLATLGVFWLVRRAVPLKSGKIERSSHEEFAYHIYLLFFLVVFYPVMFSMLLPVPLLRLFYLALGAKLGQNTYPGGVLLDPHFVSIGDNTLIGQGALLVPHVIEGAQLSHQPIEVGSHVTIGARAVVLAGCTIGDNAMVAVGAVVPKGKQIGQGEIWAGVPARCIGYVNAAP